MSRPFTVLQAPDGALDVLVSFIVEWDADPSGIEQLAGKLDQVERFAAGEDREVRLIAGTSFDLSAAAEDALRAFSRRTGIAVDVRLTSFRPPRLRPSALDLHEQGIARHREGDHEAAIALIEEAAAGAREEADARVEGVALNSLGMIHHAAGHLDDADSCLRQALALRRACGDRRGEGITRNNSGLVAMDLGRIEEAREHFDAAVRLRREVGDEAGALKTLTNLASLEVLGADGSSRHGALDDAAASADALGAAAIDPEVGLVTAAAMRGAGRHQEAAALYRRTAAAAREQGDAATELTAVYDLATVLGPLGLDEGAREALDRAEELAIDLDERSLHAAILVNRSGVLHALGRINEALQDAQLALALARDLDDTRLIGSALNTLGVHYGIAGHRDLALQCHRDAVAAAGEAGNPRGAIVAGVNAALELFKLREYEDAAAFADDALTTAREIGDEDGVGYASWTRGRVCAAAERPVEASAAFEDAVAAVESWRSGIGGDAYRAEAFGSVDYVYEDFVDFLGRAGDPVRAFEVADSAKSRWFADQLGGGPLPAPRELDPQDARLVEERDLLVELDAIDRATLAADARHSVAPQARQGAVRRRLDAVWDGLAEEAPDYVSLRRGTPTRLTEIAKALEAGTGLVAMYVLRDEVVAFVARPDTDRPDFVRTGITADALSLHVTSFTREVTDYHLGRPVAERWQSFGRQLVEPVLPCLEGLDLVYFSPHRQLHSLPLHAVRVAGAPIAEQIAVAYTPSAAVLRLVVDRDRTRSHDATRRNLVMAFTANDAERDDFEGEGRDVAARLGTESHTGAAASAQLLREAGPDAGVIHLSCHGRFDASDPMSSCVVLADGELTARDILGLQLKARLVTISACESGESGVAAGDELTGLTRAFLYAGASAVMVTMWKVHAASARWLMADLYEGGPDSLWSTAPATLLQKATGALRETHEHPFYWAPFIVVGNAGRI